MWRVVASAVLAGVVGLSGGAPAAAQGTARPARDQVTAVSVTPSVSPVPVEGTDGRIHMPYELLLVNFGTDPATIDSVLALDRGHPSRVLDSLTGNQVAAHFAIAQIGTVPGPSAVLGAGQEGIVWMDATVPNRASVPRQIVHRIWVRFPKGQAGGLVPADVTVTVAPTAVSHLPAPVVAPPLSGTRWFDANGCCSIVTAHRGSVNPLDGRTNYPERSGIDFIKLDDHDRLFTGPAVKLSSYAYYGAPVTAAADGEVVELRDGLPDQVPTMEPPLGQLPLADFAGNHVIEKFSYAGHTYYALYAHMKPGSVRGRVHLGEHLRVGQQVGQVGNSGNSAAPHLHFQVMDRPSALASQGIPYAFDRFLLRGRAASENVVTDVLDGRRFTYARGVRPQQQRCRLPLYLDLVDFPRTAAHR
ncbi:M23 family metallopeptidase [Streptacidiphilus neutrinimicus]|uniref:M23 family metallopeptidase n=1 Tax=Streptacidiphilus neutrinimicus TaxID=105420 RepID=UPI0005A65B07|nr:M23 family metallopeptidase [Streptacidiphilus neutrinimicus]